MAKYEGYDFCGWATKNDIECTDGRTIRRDAFKHCDGMKVPLIYNHNHDNPLNNLGYAYLENRPQGVYCYGYFNDTMAGQETKKQVIHGDIDRMSIFANRLKQNGSDVIHGNVIEVSLVVAGANKGARIESVVAHGDDGYEAQIFSDLVFDEVWIPIEHSDEFDFEDIDEDDEYYEDDYDGEDDVDDDDDNELEHSDDDKTVQDVIDSMTDVQRQVMYAMVGAAVEEAEASETDEDELEHSEGDNKMAKEKTVQDVIDSMTEEQRQVMYAMVGAAIEEAEAAMAEADDEDENEKPMKHGYEGGTEMANLFENGRGSSNRRVLTHADQEAIMSMAKKTGRFRESLNDYLIENDFLSHSDLGEKEGAVLGAEYKINDATLKHVFSDTDIETLFPEFKLMNGPAPELITGDLSWVDSVLNKVHKSPISRVRTRHANLTAADIRAMGYEKGTEKKLIKDLTLLTRSRDPQTIYVKDKLERDDVIDITDFDVVAYQKRIMRIALNQTIATAILIGDGLSDGAEGKIHEAHVQSIWNDSDIYTIHHDVDIEAAREELQGVNTNNYFGENYIYAEAIIQAALYAREKYKGSGAMAFYCTPHLLNVMLLARDLNGRRIYDSKTDLAAALNVTAIHTVEQFEGKQRTLEDGSKKELLGIFVNLADYQIGSTKGGEITNFEDFDIDFNQYKYLMETRMSGALTKPFSAIALEKPIPAPVEPEEPSNVVFDKNQNGR